MNYLVEGLERFILVSSAVLAAYFPAIAPNLPVQNEVQTDVIVRSGQYSYAGQTLKYMVNIPKNGGEINGKLTGACKGTITGFYKGAPSFAIDNGYAKARCPILLNKKFTVSYVAHISLYEGWAAIDWMGDLPSTNGKGSFTTYFEPDTN